MQDRPTATELLEALRVFREAGDADDKSARARFLVRVAANVAAIVERELGSGPRLLQEQLSSLAALLDREITGQLDHARQLELFDALSAELSGRIAGGDADGGPWRQAVLAYLRANVAARLVIDNPGYDAKERA